MKTRADQVHSLLHCHGLDAVIEGSPFHGALITRLRQHCQDAAVRPVLVTVDSLPQLLDHITDKEQQRAPGAEPRGWRANAAVLMTIQDFLISDALDTYGMLPKALFGASAVGIFGSELRACRRPLKPRGRESRDRSG